MIKLNKKHKEILNYALDEFSRSDVVDDIDGRKEYDELCSFIRKNYKEKVIIVVVEEGVL